VAPWLLAFRAASQPQRLIETAQIVRPLMARAAPEHEALAAEAGAKKYFRHTGWLKLYRTDRSFAAQARELELAARFGIANVPLDADAAQALEPSLKPVFRHAVPRSAALRSPATRAACTAPMAVGASIPPRVRSMPATSWWRSGRGRRI
jgi:D-amino-acid dehydrogenase